MLIFLGILFQKFFEAWSKMYIFPEGICACVLQAPGRTPSREFTPNLLLNFQISWIVWIQAVNSCEDHLSLWYSQRLPSEAKLETINSPLKWMPVYCYFTLGPVYMALCGTSFRDGGCSFTVLALGGSWDLVSVSQTPKLSLCKAKISKEKEVDVTL